MAKIIEEFKAISKLEIVDLSELYYFLKSDRWYDIISKTCFIQWQIVSISCSHGCTTSSNSISHPFCCGEYLRWLRNLPVVVASKILLSWRSFQILLLPLRIFTGSRPLLGRKLILKCICTCMCLLCSQISCISCLEICQIVLSRVHGPLVAFFMSFRLRGSSLASLLSHLLSFLGRQKYP